MTRATAFRVFVALVFVAVLVTATGCVSPGPTRPDGSSATTSGTGTGTGGPSARGNQGNQGNQGRTVRPAWAPDLGPVDPNSPPEHRWYASVSDRDCGGLLANVESARGETSANVAHIYGGLANACLGHWDAAKADLAAAGGPGDDCYVISTYATLQRFVAAHRAAPNATVAPGPAAAPTCAVPTTPGEENPAETTPPEETNPPETTPPVQTPDEGPPGATPS